MKCDFSLHKFDSLINNVRRMLMRPTLCNYLYMLGTLHQVREYMQNPMSTLLLPFERDH